MTSPTTRPPGFGQIILAVIILLQSLYRTPERGIFWKGDAIDFLGVRPVEPGDGGGVRLIGFTDVYVAHARGPE
jgi:hypothetical protein